MRSPQVTGTGSGCSAYVAKPSWQHDTGCSKRTVVDVSAVADPYTGVAVYASYGSSNNANWYVFGGTSISAPIVASVYALAGSTFDAAASQPYANPDGLFDVTSGSNGTCSSRGGKGKPKPSTTSYLCSAVSGYDGPTGLGTPNGISSF